MIGETFANLQIIREIGHGGMGVVYEAQQQAPQRRVAVKVLPPHLAADPGVAARFADEANKMARLEGHPNIAQVYAAGQSDGVPYLVMQLLRGDLDQRLRTHGALPLSDAAELAAQVADGLDYAHERGVIHRDIKPANIMFDERGRPVVTDFGIAKAMDEYRLTSTGMTLGTPQYASPEQVRGKPLDGRSDLYSLGIVLYQMISGRLPFTSDSPMGYAMQHIEEQPRRLGDFLAGMPANLERIILRCLSKDPSQRFNNGRDLAAALRAQQLPRAILQPGYTPPAAQPQPTRVMPAARPRRRPVAPLVIGLAALGVMALLAGAVALSTGMIAVAAPPVPPMPTADVSQVLGADPLPPSVPANTMANPFTPIPATPASEPAQAIAAPEPAELPEPPKPAAPPAVPARPKSSTKPVVTLSRKDEDPVKFVKRAFPRATSVVIDLDYTGATGDCAGCTVKLRDNRKLLVTLERRFNPDVPEDAPPYERRVGSRYEITSVRKHPPPLQSGGDG
ncbi:MAG: serine/threonine-protein kinase [Armatimonadia bacterium]